MSETSTVRIKPATKKRIIQTRGKMESKDGKRRSEEDVINELIDHYEAKT